jgi:hypothetical protein
MMNPRKKLSSQAGKSRKNVLDNIDPFQKSWGLRGQVKITSRFSLAFATAIFVAILGT